ncbi:MAG TPA: galactokinase [Opitutaceae bacterium]|nr:galactokinase [Opitutaceae bacterium]
MIAEAFRGRYGRPPEIIARAPGRIEFIGNHTDYNGGCVIGASLDRTVEVALARRPDGQWRFASVGREPAAAVPAGTFPKQSGPASWANYPLGVLATLPAFGLRSPSGFDYLAASSVPVGAGLSSSAAIELASALAFLRAAGEDPPRETLAALGRQAENAFVGVPCGILDQGVSAFGQADHLVFIDCRGPRFELLPLPAQAHFWIFNTHTRHALVDGLYAARHRECMEAARALGVPLLADLTPAQLAAAEAKVPAVPFRRARHVVEENARVAAASAALRAGDLAAVGRLLSASHRSSRDLFENSTPALDFLADALAGSAGVFGARLTGGGFGGAVMALTGPAFGERDAQAVAAAYQGRFGAAVDVLHARTGPGATLLE